MKLLQHNNDVAKNKHTALNDDHGSRFESHFEQKNHLLFFLVAWENTSVNHFKVAEGNVDQCKHISFSCFQ